MIWVPATYITDDIAMEIWKLKGLNRLIDIARKYGVSEAIVGSIHKGRTWNHVTGLPNSRT